jgi:hypothetical protein
MSEQAARSSARSGAIRTRTEDRNRGLAARTEDRKRTEDRNRRLAATSGLGAPSDRASSAPAPRRTVVIRGQVADRYATDRHWSGSHRASRSYGLRLRPERAALWAVLLGLALVIAALASAHM